MALELAANSTNSIHSANSHLCRSYPNRKCSCFGASVRWSYSVRGAGQENCVRALNSHWMRNCVRAVRNDCISAFATLDAVPRFGRQLCHG